MPGARLPMRKIRDVLRLTASGMSSRQVAASLGIGATTVIDFLGRARRDGIAWPLADDLPDEALEARLFPPPATTKDQRPLPDWRALHRELKRSGVTLQLLWEEYRARDPQGYGYRRFCELYRAWAKRVSPTMRQTHIAGERLFVDYAGTRLQVFDAATGEVLTAELFVAALGASSYTFAEATWDADPARLDRLAHARLCVLRRRADADGIRQSSIRHHQGLLLRARRQPQLRRDGGPLRHGLHLGASEEAARQGQGGSRRSAGDALDHRQAAERQVLLDSRAERGDRQVRRRSQQPRIAHLGAGGHESDVGPTGPATRQSYHMASHRNRRPRCGPLGLLDPDEVEPNGNIFASVSSREIQQPANSKAIYLLFGFGWHVRPSEVRLNEAYSCLTASQSSARLHNFKEFASSAIGMSPPTARPASSAQAMRSSTSGVCFPEYVCAMGCSETEVSASKMIGRRHKPS